MNDFTTVLLIWNNDILQLCIGVYLADDSQMLRFAVLCQPTKLEAYIYVLLRIAACVQAASNDLDKILCIAGPAKKESVLTYIDRKFKLAVLGNAYCCVLPFG